MSTEKKLLIDADAYLKSGSHIGTKNKSGDMNHYIFKVRPDGLSVLDVHTLDERIRNAAKMLSKYDLTKLAIVGRRLYAKTPIIKLAEETGGKAFTGRFVPGTFTNPEAREFFEPEIILVTETEPDVQAIKEATVINVPVIGLCSTNNSTKNIDLVIPVNNKGRKSIALVYYLLAREILKEKGILKEDSEFKKTTADFEYEIKEDEKRAEERKKAIKRNERRGKSKKR